MKIKSLDEKRILHKCLRLLREETELILKLIQNPFKDLKNRVITGNSLFHNANLIYSVSITHQGKGEYSLSIVKSIYFYIEEETLKFKTEKEFLETEESLIKKHTEKSGYKNQIIETIEL